jgi:hypothetical protein
MNKTAEQITAEILEAKLGLMKRCPEALSTALAQKDSAMVAAIAELVKSI